MNEEDTKKNQTPIDPKKPSIEMEELRIPFHIKLIIWIILTVSTIVLVSLIFYFTSKLQLRTGYLPYYIPSSFNKFAHT